MAFALVSILFLIPLNVNSIIDGYSINPSNPSYIISSNYMILKIELDGNMLFNFWISSAMPNTLNINKYAIKNNSASLMNTFTFNLSSSQNITVNSISADYTNSNIIIIAISYIDYSVENIKQIIQIYQFKLN